MNFWVVAAFLCLCAVQCASASFADNLLRNNGTRNDFSPKELCDECVEVMGQFQEENGLETCLTETKFPYCIFVKMPWKIACIILKRRHGGGGRSEELCRNIASGNWSPQQACKSMGLCYPRPREDCKCGVCTPYLTDLNLLLKGGSDCSQSTVGHCLDCEQN